MASDKGFVDYVAEQLRDAGSIRVRAMFGEYGLYCDNVFFAVICDDQLFVKTTPQGEAAFPHLPKAPPYEGAKDSFLVEDVDNRETLTELTRITCQALGERTPRKRKETPVFDYKKSYREFYLPPKTPHILEIPAMQFLAVRGRGDPNEEGGAYQSAIQRLYQVAYTIKMSKKGSAQPEGYFDYVMPPLEGLWWMEGAKGMDLTRKGDFCWIALLRLPEFVTREVFDWAVKETAEKKKADLSSVEYLSYEEGLCVQCMHIGTYDSELETIRAMERFAAEQGYRLDDSGTRRHHELYLSDVRRCSPEKRKTVLRLPLRRET